MAAINYHVRFWFIRRTPVQRYPHDVKNKKRARRGNTRVLDRTVPDSRWIIEALSTGKTEKDRGGSVREGDRRCTKSDPHRRDTLVSRGVHETPTVYEIGPPYFP
jgi:hypothetical protein